MTKVSVTGASSGIGLAIAKALTPRARGKVSVRAKEEDSCLSGSAVPALWGRLLVFVSSKAVRVWQTVRRRSYLQSIASVLRLHRNLLPQRRPRTQVLQVSAGLAGSSGRRRQAPSALAS